MCTESIASLKEMSLPQIIKLMRILWDKNDLGTVSNLRDYCHVRFGKVISMHDLRLDKEDDTQQKLDIGDC